MSEYILAIMFFAIGYLLGRHHQWSLDDEIPVLFLYKKTENSNDEYDKVQAITKDVIVFRGEWITRDEASNAKGIIIQCDDGKNFMLFNDICEVPENNEALVNIAKKHKLNSQRYLLKRFLLARKIKEE